MSLPFYKIAKAVAADEFGSSAEAIMSPTRVWPHPLARQVAYYLVWCRGRTYPQIGRWFGRDHTSIIYGVLKIKAMIALDPWLADKIKTCLARTKASDLAPRYTETGRAALLRQARAAMQRHWGVKANGKRLFEDCPPDGVGSSAHAAGLGSVLTPDGLGSSAHAAGLGSVLTPDGLSPEQAQRREDDQPVRREDNQPVRREDRRPPVRREDNQPVRREDRRPPVRREPGPAAAQPPAPPFIVTPPPLDPGRRRVILRRFLPHTVDLGDPAPGRSALDQRRAGMAAADHEARR